MNLDHLPIAAETSTAIRDWRDRVYNVVDQEICADAHHSGQLDQPTEFPSRNEGRAIEAEGKRLCDQLRTELDDEW
jgi:hypothetical protein